MSPLLTQAQFQQSAMSPEESITYYQSRYPLSDPYKKLVDNRGNGFEPLYGVRNLRAVLNGVVYRGGANNVYNKYGKRQNSNPLPEGGLRNLCEEGFGTSVYLYSTNYEKAPKTIRCDSDILDTNTLTYRQESVLSDSASAQRILYLVHQRLSGSVESRPIYLHCWNGWHASGYISALILRQFCGYSGEQAVNYWNINTDGNNVGSNYDKIRDRIKNFKMDPNLIVSANLKSKVCPKIN